MENKTLRLLMNESADEIAIKELFVKRDAAWNVHDATAWSSFFEADGHFTSWRGHRVQGRDNIRAFHERLFTGIYKTTTNTTIGARITFHGADLAIAENDTKMTGTLDPSGHPEPDRRYYPLIVLKKNNGKWEISIFHNVRDQT
jgi:uncharacterized protein (TIGR02246 family)